MSFSPSDVELFALSYQVTWFNFLNLFLAHEVLDEIQKLSKDKEKRSIFIFVWENWD